MLVCKIKNTFVTVKLLLSLLFLPKTIVLHSLKSSAGSKIDLRLNSFLRMMQYPGSLTLLIDPGMSHRYV